jgi:hypothetical protein
MTPKQYFEFIHAWKTQRQSNFISIKIAILKNLLDGSNSFTRPIQKYGTSWYSIPKVWSTEKPLPEPPMKRRSSFSDLVLSRKPPFDNALLEAFFKSTTPLGGSYFIEGNYQDFSLQQLEAVVKVEPLFSLIPTEVQGEIQQRIEDLRNLQFAHGQNLNLLKI